MSKPGYYIAHSPRGIPLIVISCVCFSVCLFGCTAQHAGSYFPDQGSNLCPLQSKCRVLTTGPPGKSLLFFLVLH